jgi:hypothetical protein
MRITLKPLLETFFVSAEDGWNWLRVMISDAFGISGVEPSSSVSRIT